MKEGWIYTTIGESCDINYGTRVVRARDGGSIYDVYGGGGATFKMDTYNREDCVVIARFAMSKLCTRSVKGKFYLNDSGLTITPKEGSSLQQFLLDKLILALNDTIYECGRGSAQRNLRVDEFKEIKFAYPREVSEQERIVSFLDAEFAKIDALKANTEQQLQAAKDLFQSALKELLAPKDGWEKRCLGNICDILNGFAFKSSEYVHSGIRVIRITNVQKGIIVDNAPKFYPEKYIDILSNYILKDGDLLMSLTGNVGRVGILPKEMLPAALNQRVACLRIKDKSVSKAFLYFLLNSNNFEDLCIKNSTGAAQLNMSTVWLTSVQIPIPSLPEQERIAARLDAISEKVKALQVNYDQTITLCNDLKQSLLKSIFE